MNGFTKVDAVFNLGDIQTLQETAKDTYFPTETVGIYPTGGIPAGEGSGVYAYDAPLTTYNPTLDPSSSIYHLIFTQTDEIITVEDRHLAGAGEGGGGKLAINGTYGSNQTLIIRGNKFENIDHRCIYIKNVDNIIIEGNYFTDIKKGMSIYWFKNLTIRYNKFRNHATGTYNAFIGNHVWGASSVTYNEDGSVLGGGTADSIECAYNLVDRSDAPYAGLDLSDGSADRNDAALAADYMNFRMVHMSAGNVAQVHNNVGLGSEHLGEAQSGCGIIIDHDCHDFSIYNNLIVNTTGTCFGSANSNGTWESNIGGHSNKANRNLTYPYRTDPLDPNYGLILKHITRFIALTYYTGHSCDAADGVAGPHIVKNNRGCRMESDDIGANMSGSVDTNTDISHVDGTNTWNLLENNSFGWRPDDPVYPDETYIDDSVCPYTKWRYYFNVINPTDVNPPLPPTTEELYRLVLDPTYVMDDPVVHGEFYTAGMTTNNALFLKWGTANNHSMYFDESRTV